MRSRSRGSSHLTFHPIVVASAIVFTVLFLALGYHTGVNHVEQAHQPHLQEIKHEIDRENAKLVACNTQTNELMKEVGKSNSQVKKLQEAVDGLLKEQNETQTLYIELDEQDDKCTMEHVEVERRIRDLNEQDAQQKREVEDMTKEVDALQVSIQQLTRGEGMSVVLLLEVVKALRAYYEVKCRKMPGCVELTDEDLLQLRVEENRTEAEIEAIFERDAAAQKTLANALTSPNANLTGIYFLPLVREETTLDTKQHAPKYFKRSIAEKPRKGAKGVGAKHVSGGRVVQLLELYTNYAMCAYRYNNAGFSFQSYFLYPTTTGDVAAAQEGPSQVDAYLHRLIVSPLLQYCVQCDASAWGPQYRLACSKHTASHLRNYGTLDFWRVRSMIQAAPAIQTEALNYYQDRELQQRRVLAVVYHSSSEQDRQKCDRAATRGYGIHYQYLLANFPDDEALKVHVADDRQVQCSPTPAQIIEHINRVRKAASSDFGNIYLSVSAETRSNVLALLKQQDMDLYNRVLPVPSCAEKEAEAPGFTELLDLEIASRATEILVNPFLAASRYVTEEFLLRQKLAPGNRIWVF